MIPTAFYAAMYLNTLFPNIDCMAGVTINVLVGCSDMAAILDFQRLRYVGCERQSLNLIEHGRKPDLLAEFFLLSFLIAEISALTVQTAVMFLHGLRDVGNGK